MKSYSCYFILILTFALVGCAGRESKNTAAKTGYVPLSEAEAKVYITPTIYYIPQYDLTVQSCEVSARKSLKDKTGNTLFSVCPLIYDACLMQGTCELKTEQGRVLVNVAGRVNSDYRFSKVQNKICRFGYGAGKSICLDPFHSIAADLSIYSLGQVVYIPTAVGIHLPDGAQHDGYFIIRDSGGSIKGHGRFDFFTGFKANNRSQNPLSQIGFAGKETHVQYYVLSADEAQAVLKKRNYPLIPVAN